MSKSNGNENKKPEDNDDKKENTWVNSFTLSQHLKVGIRLVLLFSVICSLLYPSIVTGIGEVFWEQKAVGSPVYYNGEKIGSLLIGQQYDSDIYFHARPSSITYDATHSGSENLSPNNEKLLNRIKTQCESLYSMGILSYKIPISFVTESGSALDPHISPQAAYLQIPRISQATGIPILDLIQLVDSHIEKKFLGIFGQERVNIVMLNLELKKIMEKEQ